MTTLQSRSVPNSAPANTSMPLPAPRGPVSERLVSILQGDDGDTTTLVAGARALAETYADVARGIVYDEDAQISLTMLYELHLQGLVGVGDDWEWNTDLLAARSALEVAFEAAVRDIAAAPTGTTDVVAALWELTAPTAGPGLSGFMAKEADITQFRELLVHRSLNQLREADVHTLGIPRLAGVPKAALVEVQADEYGGGRPERMHSTLFATTMREVGLSDRYAHYIDAVPAVTLASLNALSMFGLHRRLLGALVGHLCAVETTSALPSKKYSAGLRRLGFGRAATLFFDEHVEADSVHEQIVCRDLAGGLAAARPSTVDDIMFGAAACLAFDDLVGDHVVTSWADGRTSLRRPTLGAADS
ncbi:MAG: iron-containing redox enzyme family protein [Rhodococcus sp. (in: high G+C Gram-positive bacteria)]|uniref:iron-containing redox enzyme family protein n=1 Tax=Rhodococcus sp. TaxID=1831 RepID=UPI003BB1F692